MIENIEDKLSDFKFVTSKAEILTDLIIYNTLKKDYKKSDDLFKKYLSVLETEPMYLARSKIISDSLHLMNKHHEHENINKYIGILLPKIEKPFFKIRAQIDKLQYLSEMDDKEQVLVEINNIDKEFREIHEVNTLIAIERVINPIHFKKNSLYYIDKNSLDVTTKNYLTNLSKLAAKFELTDLIKSHIPEIDKIRLQVYRDISLRNVINNFYEIAIRKKDVSLASEIFNLSKSIKHASYHAETLYKYSMCLKNNNNFDEIIKLIESQLDLIPKTTGEYSRAIILQETLNMICNLDEDSKKEDYLEKIITLNEEFQGTFTSIQVNLKMIEVYHELNKLDKARELLKKAILYSGMITSFEIFIIIYNKIVDVISAFPKLLDDETCSYFLTKTYETKNTIQRTRCLIDSTNKIPFSNQKLTEINENLDQINKPFVYYNEIFLDHLFPILKFSINNAFLCNDDEIMKDPFSLVEKAQTAREKCLLLLELVILYKKNDSLEQMKKCENQLLQEINNITNEFQKKEIVIEIIRRNF